MEIKLISLIKIAKQKLLEHERSLANNQALIMRLHSEIDKINVEISAIEMPVSGNFASYQMSRAGIHAYLYKIDDLRSQISILLKEQETIKKNIRIAHLNHEKMIYVYNQAKNKKDAYLKTIEDKQLDETSIMLHARAK